MSDSGLSESDRVELWRHEQFVRLGFDVVACKSLLFWQTSPHEAEDLIRRGCPHATALAILEPLELFSMLPPDGELAEQLAGYSMKV